MRGSRLLVFTRGLDGMMAGSLTGKRVSDHSFAACRGPRSRVSVPPASFLSQGLGPSSPTFWWLPRGPRSRVSEPTL